ncbi:ABC transporter ATP-binding protein [Sandaracinus amylolyticus]|uniref:Lipid A export ATP-binding/permease protein MsbA n=1 Tax=Sandaracinus amylolyticus TaxID=927083 RepID=A0A0F6SFF2_9BACT|nr:ABC transporter ATP-binding protein [Sandaracinus amylolyticus]AKF06839.1 Lipid A export ATP-binding/permease protein MsbA [Sandaracinus amylolyticus]
MSSDTTTTRDRVRPPLESGGGEKTYDLALLKRLVPWARKHWVLFAITFLLVPVSALAGLVQPLLIRDAIDSALVDRSATMLGRVTLFFGIAVVVDFVARFAQQYALQLGGQRTIADLRAATYEKVQRLPLAYLDKTPVGRVVTRVTNDSDAMGELFASGAVLAIADVVTLVGIVCFMLYLDVRLTLVVCCALPPLALAVNAIRKRMREAFREIRATIAQLNAYVAEQVQGIAIVQAFGRERDCLGEYREINAHHRDANYRSIRYDALLFSIVESISAITVALVLWYASVRSGVLDATSSAAYVGTVVAFYEYIQRFFVPIRELSQKYTILQSSLAAAERVFALLDMDERDAPEGLDVGEVPKVPEGVALAFRDVEFAYRAGHPVVRDLELDVHRGETIAIVGATGAGKTTLTALLLRLYDVTRGHVLVDGEDVRALHPDTLRSRFAVVPQDVFLFSGTILENVSAFAESPDVARVEDALRRVGAWPMVERRGGLDVKIDERGANFSAGERQLLAFARALYLDRPYLILDEATANVDSETEARLQHAVAALLRGRTSLVIAHRLSTIRNADRIVVMHRGRIAEIGTHDELIAKGGLYARLHHLQFLDETEGTVSGEGAAVAASAS